jgi:hypothetical protein
MSPLSQQAIDALKEIHKNTTGDTLSDEEAEAMGKRLLQIFAILPSELPHDRGETSRGAHSRSNLRQ